MKITIELTTTEASELLRFSNQATIDHLRDITTTQAARKLGGMRSRLKAQTAKVNGAKGGRPVGS